MKNSFLLFCVMFFTFITVQAQTVIITESAGWLETAFVKWQPVSGAESYHVYYSGEGITNQKIDTQLIRNYGTYMRADVLGLKAGTYSLKVVPVVSGVETTGASTGDIKVLAHDRTGFAFSGNRVPGAYKADGTTKDNAVILYITQNTKNTVSLVVIGATSNPCIGLQTIFDGFKKGKDSRPLIVRMIGQITDLNYLLGGDIVIENANIATSYITLEGVGEDAVADGWGVRIKNASNIEVRNISTMNCNSSEGDNIGLQQSNDYIWIHNCDFFYGDAGSDSDQAKGDGALDCKKSTFVTFSYNHFWDSGKSNLLGLSEGISNDLLITYHHNWYDHSDSRHPRVRFYSAHVYNNYYDGNSKYGIGSTMGSSVFVEANYFRNCKYPMLTSMQGSDVWDESKQTNDYKNMPTFSNEDGGVIKAFNNDINGANRFVPYAVANFPISTKVDFDAFVVSSQSEQVPNTVKSAYGANTYNNFDTNASVMYNYTPDSPTNAKEKVINYAGRTSGGDFKWAFDNKVDDASAAVNQLLKTALIGYKTKLISVQGESGSSNSTQTLTSTTDNNQTVEDGNPIQPMVFTWGGDANDVNVTVLPASGISFIKDALSKTVTISGIPTANLNFTVVSSGAIGMPTTISGSITLVGSAVGDMVHNFTLAGKISSFYNITGNLSDSKGIVNYAGLSLTQCLKMESSTNITFTTSVQAILTLVFNENFTGKININGLTYNPNAGILTITIPAGNNTITKGDTSNLYYMSVVYSSTGVANNEAIGIKLYPNPVTDNLTISANSKIESIEIYYMSGILVRRNQEGGNILNMKDLKSGNYLVKVKTKNDILQQIIFKK